MESEIESLEEKLALLDAEMAKPEVAADFEQISKIQEERKQLQSRVEETTENWETVLMELEEIGEQLGLS